MKKWLCGYWVVCGCKAEALSTNLDEISAAMATMQNDCPDCGRKNRIFNPGDVLVVFGEKVVDSRGRVAMGRKSGKGCVPATEESCP